MSGKKGRLFYSHETFKRTELITLVSRMYVSGINLTRKVCVHAKVLSHSLCLLSCSSFQFLSQNFGSKSNSMDKMPVRVSIPNESWQHKWSCTGINSFVTIAVGHGKYRNTNVADKFSNEIISCIRTNRVRKSTE